jgi:glycosyltransferase involved in cell wall biosynthesis
MNKKTRICLNSMVGNEAKTITRMLESVAPYIDYYVIQCNGKEDNTKEIIDDFFKSKNISGFSYETDWEYPGFNRDGTLQTCLKADHGCDWILRMDADERLHVDEDFDWSVLEDTSIQSFNIGAEAYSTKYFRTWFWNSKLPWFFQHDRRHETIHLPEIGESFQRINMPWGFRHKVSQDGETWHVPRKFLNDALELEKEKIVGYKVLEDYYHLWYIAKSYADCYGNPSELPFGKMHSDEYARRSIWYYERYLHLTNDWDNGKTAKETNEMSYYALIMMAHAHDFIGNKKESEEHFLLAEQFLPERNEHLVYLCIFLEKEGRFEEMIPYIDKMLQPERINPFPKYSFLIEDRAYHNTSDYLVNLKKRIQKKSTEFSINLDSLDFDFK